MYSSDAVPAYWGYISLFISSAFYGLNYVPVKKYETGDGMFFQLVVCIGIWQTGIVIDWIRGFPKFYATAVIGGFLWTTGNVNCVAVIKLIGIGLGSLFWNASGLIIGWAYARFGLFGIKPQEPTDPALNYVGIVFGIISTIALVFVKPSSRVSSILPESRPLLERDGEVGLRSLNYQQPSNDVLTRAINRMSEKTRVTVGSLLGLFIGAATSLAYAPLLNIQCNDPGASQNNMDYAFSQSTGIFLGSIFYFAVYCVFKKNSPDVYPRIVLPGLITGWLWGVANALYFLATNSLSQSITNPIANVGPSCFACFAGLYFGEVRGLKNYFILTLAVLLATVSSVLIGISA